MLVFSACGLISAQHNTGITPMHLFFKDNADSTLIMEYPTHSYDPPTYRILTKSGDTITLFEYAPILPYQNGIKMSKKLRASIFFKKIEQTNGPADINAYFNGIKLADDSLKNFWTETRKLNPWLLAPDRTLAGCPTNKPIPAISHTGEIIFYLITKDQVKRMEYIGVHHIEASCPGNITRQRVINLQKLFEYYFQNKPN